jgi:hypothetical protein
MLQPPPPGSLLHVRGTHNVPEVDGKAGQARYKFKPQRSTQTAEVLCEINFDVMSLVYCFENVWPQDFITFFISLFIIYRH